MTWPQFISRVVSVAVSVAGVMLNHVPLTLLGVGSLISDEIRWSRKP